METFDKINHDYSKWQNKTASKKGLIDSILT